MLWQRNIKLCVPWLKPGFLLLEIQAEPCKKKRGGESLHICIWQDYFINFQDIQFVFLLFQVNFWIKWDVNLIYYISLTCLNIYISRLLLKSTNRYFSFPSMFFLQIFLKSSHKMNFHLSWFQIYVKYIFVFNSITAGHQYEKSIQEFNNSRSAGSFKEQHS